MKKNSFKGPLAILIFAALAVTQQKEPRLAQKYETWITEEVVYIISPTEKDVFYKLESDRERDLFIEEFWKQRDPTPGTPRNEFKDEHYRRIEFVNKRFGPGSSKKGWRTDRGRIYIKLGPPVDVQRFVSSNTYPMELWYYWGNPQLGQASTLRLLFFQEFGAAEYRLYHPIKDGPKSLLHDPWRTAERSGLQKVVGDPSALGPSRTFPAQWDETDRNAYLLLTEFGTDEVAEATFSLIPGSHDIGSQIMSSTILLGDVEVYPQKKIKGDYALDFLNHKATVEVSYSVFFMNNRHRLAVLKNPGGTFTLHYVIVPASLTLENYLDTYFADLKTNLRLSDESGKTIYQGEKYIPIELRKEELKAVKASSFQLYDSLPVIPGVYKLNFLLENTASKEFTTIEQEIVVPDGEGLGMSPVILARKADRGGTTPMTAQAFQAGPFRLYPSVNNVFQKKDRVFVFFQVYGLSKELRESGFLECAVYADTAPVLTSPRRQLGAVEAESDFLEEFSTDTLAPGTYALKASLFDKRGTELLAGSAPFIVSQTAVPDAWVAAQTGPPPDDAQTFYLLGTQFLNKGQIERAVELLRDANAKTPQSLEFAVEYARALLITKNSGKAKEVLAPWVGSEEGNFDLYECLGRAAQNLGEYQEAIPHYQKALSLKGNVVEVLNSLGECFAKLGDSQQARRVWQKSLEIDPNQQHIRNLINELKK